MHKPESVSETMARLDTNGQRNSAQKIDVNVINKKKITPLLVLSFHWTENQK